MDKLTQNDNIPVSPLLFFRSPKLTKMRDPLSAHWNRALAEKLEPVAVDGSINLAHLIDFSQLKETFTNYLDVVGLPVAIVDLKGQVLVSSKWQRLCMEFHRVNKATLARCVESDVSLSRQMDQGKGYALYRCRNGLTDCAAPIMIDGQHIANLFVGQFFLQPPDHSYFAAQRSEFGFDPDAYDQALAEVPIVNEAKVPAIMQLLVGLANQLAQQSLAEHHLKLAYENLKAQTLDLQESEHQLHLAINHHEKLFESAPDAMVMADAGGVIIKMNQNAEQFFGYPRSELLGQPIERLLPARSRPQHLLVRHDFAHAQRSGQMGADRDVYAVTKSGQEVPVNINLSTIQTEQGPMVIAAVRDISDRQQSQARLQLLASVFSNSNEAILVTDAINRIVAINPAFTQLTGYSQEDVIGETPKILSAGTTPPMVYAQMWESLKQTGAWQGELQDRRKSGEHFPKWLSIVAARDAAGQIVNYIGSFVDITERKASLERVRFLAHHDALTGLYNRFSLHEKLELAIDSAKRSHRQLALMLIDLDHFKSINDTLGHSIGDELLIQVANRLNQVMRENASVARLGGDEFVVVLPDIASPKDAAQVAEKIIYSISQPYQIAGQFQRTSPSIGICIYPDDACDSENLLKNADMAMYEAKANGRAAYRYFTAAMMEAASTRMRMEADLRIALEQGQFLLYYQPQLSLKTGGLVGVEALIRWQHPTLGMVSPVDFIPIAEDTGLIIPIGDWVLREACRQVKLWNTHGLAHIRISVNLSASQFMDTHLPDRIQTILHDADLSSDCLDLEVTESMSMASPQQAIAMMHTLTKLGLSLSIDDFGTGYSSLAYLKLFPIQTLKIDRSFVKDIETDSNDADICDVSVLLAHRLGLDVVAEGVETEAQLKFLQSIGCEKIQGYLISKPLPASEAEAFLRNATIRT